MTSQQKLWRKIKESDPIILVGTVATFVAAIASAIAAVTSAESLVEQRKQTQAQNESNKPFITALAGSGDNKAALVSVTIFNPGEKAYRFYDLIIENPIGWKAAEINPAEQATDDNIKHASMVINIDANSYPQRVTPFSTSTPKLIVVDDPSVTGDERKDFQTMIYKNPDTYDIKFALRGYSIENPEEKIVISATVTSPTQ